MRTQLVNQTAIELLTYLYNSYNILVNPLDIKRIIDNNLGFIVDAIEEQAVEVVAEKEEE
jgi:hypothetical protein